ncbi:MAG: hypothetical protein AAGD32_11850 [Planctomycetota bacterium]
MKLVPRRSEGSFYESFSDLIFCTLVLFIVIVMALVLKLGQAGGGGAGGAALVPTEQLDQALADAKQLRAELADAARLAAQAQADKAAAEDELRRAAAEFARLAAKAKADAERALADAAAAAADATNELVFPNRFQGSTGQTYFNLIALPIEGDVWVAWTDADINARWYLNRSGTRTTDGPDPVRELCRAVLDDQITMMPLEQFLLMAPDLGFVDYDEHMVVNGAVASAVYLAWRFQNEVGAGPGAARRLRDLIGGRDFGSTTWYDDHEANTKRMRADVLNAYREQLNFSYGPTRTDPTYHHDLIDERFRAVHPRANTNGNWVRFTANGVGRVRVGRLSMTAKQLKNILRSYDPGGGFYVEYVDANGDPADPPLWVMEQVLIPAGMNARIVNEDALR